METKWILISRLKPSDLDLHCFKPGYILAQQDKDKPHRDGFKQFCRADQGSTLFAYGNMIRHDPTLVDRTYKFFVLCTNVKVY